MKPSGQLLASELNDPNNPYNTHGKKGLPIGPISNPGEAALNGAANPATGNWVYFVAVDGNGTTKFAVTWSEFCGYKREAVRNGVQISLSDCP
jgi:peptidoglycan lytic transglycosylase G